MIDILYSSTEYLEKQLKKPNLLSGYHKAIEQELQKRKEQEQDFIEL